MTRPALSLKNVDPRAALRDALLVAAGSVLFAVGLNSFLEPNGLAPGGITGIAIIVRALILAAGGPELPVGVQTLAMNAALMLLALRVGGPRYVLRSLAGVVLSAVAIDALPWGRGSSSPTSWSSRPLPRSSRWKTPCTPRWRCF